MTTRFSIKPLLLGAAGIAAACSLAACSQGNGDHGNKVRIALNVPYAPFEYQDSDGNLKGFDVDLGKAMCKEAQLECSWQSQSWDSLIPSLMSRKTDAIMSAMTINDERRQQVLFSDPYVVLPSGWFAPANTASSYAQISPDTLKGKRIAVQRGTLQDNYVTDLYGENNTIVRYGSLDDIAVDMQAGRADLSFVDYPTGHDTFTKGADSKFKHVGELVSEPKKYFGEGAGVAFRPRDKALADKFNKALATLKQNGTYQKIYQEYFPDAD